MRKGILLLTLAMTAGLDAADPKLEAALEQLTRYDYDQGRQPILDLEALIRNLPKQEVENRFLAYLGSKATLASKDFICRQLSLLGSDASVPVLESMLSSQDTAEMARYALERIPGPATAAALRNGLTKAPEKARPGIVNTLGIKRDAQAAGALSKLAESPDKVLAESAISALGRIATPPALTTLAALRKKGSESAMEASIEAADYLVTGNGRAAALAVYRELSASTTPVMYRIAALHGLSSALGKEAIPQLTAVMKEADPRVQAAAIRFLNAIPGPEATAAMQSELGKLSPAARVRVVTALAARGDRSAFPTILKAAKDTEESVRTAALTALAATGDASAAGLLAETASSESATEAERTAARATLDRMPGAAVDKAIVAAIPGAGTPKLKAELIRSAGERAIAEAAPVLMAAARDADANVKREAFRALRETAGSPQVPALLELLSTGASAAGASAADRREIERSLSAALRRSPASRSTEVAAAYRSATGTEARASLLQVMGQAGTSEVRATLLSALQEKDAEVVRAAILGLTEWPDDGPLPDVLAFAGKTTNPAHQVLSLRAVLKLMELPAKRSAADSVAVLGTVMKLAQQPTERRSVLAMITRFPTKEALQIAEAAEADPGVATEAKAAVQRLRRSLGIR